MNDFFDNIENISVGETKIKKNWEYILTINTIKYTGRHIYVLDYDVDMIQKVMSRDLNSLLFVDIEGDVEIEVQTPTWFSKTPSYTVFSVEVYISGKFKSVENFIDFLIAMDVWFNHRNCVYEPINYNYSVAYQICNFGYNKDRNDEELMPAPCEIQCPLKELHRFYDLNNARFYDLAMKCITNMCKFLGIVKSYSDSYSKVRYILGLYDNGVINSALAIHNRILRSYIPKARGIDNDSANYLKQYSSTVPKYAKLNSLGELIENPPDDVWTTLGIFNYQKCIGNDYFQKCLYNLRKNDIDDEVKILLNNIEPFSRKHEIMTRAFYNDKSKDVFFVCRCGQIYIQELDICAIVTYGAFGSFENVKRVIEKLL